MSEENSKKYANIIIFIVFFFIALLSFILIFFHNKEMSEFVTALMCALSSLSVGIVIGFLFAIPKTKENNENKDNLKRRYSYSPNSNLVEVSDWLTKIIVGVGLVEFQNIVLTLDKAAITIAKSMGENADTHEPYIMALLIFYLMFGFLSGYLLTRVLLANLFSKADRDIDNIGIIEERVQVVEEQISDHSEVESLVAQADYYRRKSQEENISYDEKNKWLKRAEATLGIAINIDKNNIPAYISLSKCFSDRDNQEKAWKTLDELKENLKKRKINAKTLARIDYNKACYYVLYADSHNDKREEMLNEAFNLLDSAVKAEILIRDIAKTDEDLITVRENEHFKKIMGITV